MLKQLREIIEELNLIQEVLLEVDEQECDCDECRNDAEEDWNDDDYDDEDEDWYDDDYYDGEDEPLERVYPETLDGIHVLFVMNPSIEEGKLIADPYVDSDWKIALGHSYQEVENKYGDVIHMLNSAGYETVILQPSHTEVTDMIIKGMKYIPLVKNVREASSIRREVISLIEDGEPLTQKMVDKLNKLIELEEELEANEDKNYHA